MPTPSMKRPIAAALIIESVVIAGLLTIALDITAHKRVERLGGVNIWGYRGPVMPQKRPNEIRIAVVGGDLAFGWGIAASETLAPTLRQFVSLETDKPGGALRPVTSVDLGAVHLPPGQYAAWIDRFAYLRPDVICIVADPRERHLRGVPVLPNRESAPFALFGYVPILPLVVEQKGELGRSTTLQRLGRALAHADAAGFRLIVPASGRENGGAGRQSSASYARSIEAAARAALRAGAAVVIVAPPYDGAADAEVRDHEAVAGVIASRFANEPRVAFVDLGDEADVYDDGLWLRELALSTAGQAKAAEYVTPAVLNLIAAR